MSGAEVMPPPASTSLPGSASKVRTVPWARPLPSGLQLVPVQRSIWYPPEPAATSSPLVVSSTMDAVTLDIGSAAQLLPFQTATREPGRFATEPAQSPHMTTSPFARTSRSRIDVKTGWTAVAGAKGAQFVPSQRITHWLPPPSTSAEPLASRSPFAIVANARTVPGGAKPPRDDQEEPFHSATALPVEPGTANPPPATRVPFGRTVNA